LRDDFRNSDKGTKKFAVSNINQNKEEKIAPHKEGAERWR
jgi:hypothetical protein